MRTHRTVKRYRIKFRAVVIAAALLLVLGTVAVIHIGKISDLKTADLSEENIRSEQIFDFAEKVAVRGEKVPSRTSDKAVSTLLPDEERALIEKVVAAEARGESLEGMVAVAQTIKDRGDLWGMSYTEVVTAPCQFAAPYEGEISPEVAEAVSLVFDYGCRAYEEPVTHFFSGAAPYWVADKVCRGQIGGHQFWY